MFVIPRRILKLYKGFKVILEDGTEDLEFNGFKIDDEDGDPVQNEADKRKGNKSVNSVVCNSVDILTVGGVTCLSSISKIQRSEMP